MHPMLHVIDILFLAGDNEEEKQALFILIALLFKSDPAERLSFVLEDYQVICPLHMYADPVHVCMFLFPCQIWGGGGGGGG